MTKLELSASVAESHGITKNGASAIVETIFKEITSTLFTGGEVILKGFGRFSTEATAQRLGRNPKTGEKIIVPAGGKVKFKSFMDKDGVVNAIKIKGNQQ